MCSRCPEPESPTTRMRILRNFGYFGYFLHMHWGGRNGKQHILVELLFHDGQMTQRDLQEASCITSASLSEVISKLETEGLVTRERSETDRRQLTVTLTEAGTQRAREHVKSRRKFEEDAFTCLTEEEEERLLEMLDRLSTRWNEIEEEQKGDSACSKG